MDVPRINTGSGGHILTQRRLCFAGRRVLSGRSCTARAVDQTNVQTRSGLPCAALFDSSIMSRATRTGSWSGARRRLPAGPLRTAPDGRQTRDAGDDRRQRADDGTLTTGSRRRHADDGDADDREQTSDHRATNGRLSTLSGDFRPRAETRAGGAAAESGVGSGRTERPPTSRAQDGAPPPGSDLQRQSISVGRSRTPTSRGTRASGEQAEEGPGSEGGFTAFCPCSGARS